MKRTKRSGIAVGHLVVLLLVVFAGCEGGCFGLDEPQGKVFKAVDLPQPEPRCESVEFLPAGAKPFERVDLAILVWEFFEGKWGLREGGFGVEIEYEGYEEGLYLPVYYDEGRGMHYFIAPHHPEGLGGGEAWLRFTDMEVSCEGRFAWQVEAIEAAPDEVEAVIGEASALSRAVVESYGLDPEELVESDPEALPVMMIPLVYHIWMMDHPENEQSFLNRLVEKRLPVEISEEELGVVGAYLREAGVRESLVQARADLGQLETVEPRFREASPMRGESGTGEVEQALCSSLSGLMEVEINDGAELSHYMKRADIAAVMGEKVEVVSNLVSLLSIPPGVSRVMGSFLGLFLTIDKLMRSAHANTLPRYLYEPKVRQWEAYFHEDQHEAKSWSGYTVSAGTEGWEATADLADAFVDVVTSVAEVPGMPSSVMNRVRQKMNIPTTLMEQINDGVLDLLVASEIKETTRPILNQQGLCRIEPGPWEEIELAVNYMTESRYLGSVASAYVEGAGGLGQFCYEPSDAGQDHRDYLPRHAGMGLIRVEANSEQFPPATNGRASRWEAEVEVLPIEVRIEPGRRAAVPGEVIEVEGQISHAENVNGIWSIPEGSAAEFTRGHTGFDGESNEGGGRGRDSIEVAMPEDASQFPVVVALESIAGRGTRAPGCFPEARTDFVVIGDGEELHLSPKFRCIGEDEQLRLEATVVSREAHPAVKWSVSGGSVEGDGRHGVFRPEGRGEYTISAEVEGTRLKDTARVRVGPCECFYDVTMRGAFVGSYGGFEGIKAGLQDGELILQFGKDETAAITAKGVLARQTGYYETFLGSFRAPGAWGPFAGTSIMAGDEDTFLVITRWTEDNYIQGYYRGISGVGLQAEGIPVELPPTVIEVHFMTPISNALGYIFSAC